MREKILAFLVFLIISILLAGCATPPISTATEVPTSTSPPATTTATNTPTSTQTPTLKPTPTETPTPTVTPTATPTNTPVPEFTELGLSANEFAEVIKFRVRICGPKITEENRDRGIFLYQEDTDNYFCGFSGFTEPVEQTKFQHLLVLGDFVGVGGYSFGIVRISNFRYFYPSRYNVEGVAWSEGSVDPSFIRMWPLTEWQFELLLKKFYPSLE